MDQIVERPRPGADGRTEPIESVLSLDEAGRPKKRRGRMLPLVGLALLIAVAGAGAYYWLVPSEPTITYRTVAAERGPLTVEVSATGTLQPLTQVEVSSELSGIVRAVHVDENQRVAAGDLLAELDTTRVEAQIERARANVAAAAARVTDAEVTLAEAEQTLTRTQQLAERGMTTEQARETAAATRDRAASAVAIARSNVAVSEAELSLQQADLAQSRIYAPIDGIVLTRSVNPGQTVASSMSAPVLFVIAENLETMELKAAIDEADIGMVAAGQDARFTVDAFPERRFDAEIRDIAFASIVTEGVVTYEARLDVDNAELLLRPGMTATVDIVTRQDDDVLMAPASALRFSPQQTSTRGGGFSLQSIFNPRVGGFGGRGPRGGGAERSGRGGAAEGRPLYVLRDGQPQMVRVVTGATDGDTVEILSGLEPGDAVIVSAASPR